MLMAVSFYGVLMTEKLSVNCAFHQQPSQTSVATPEMEEDYWLYMKQVT